MGRAADVVSELLVPEPLEHSVLVVPLEVGDSSVGNMTVLDPLEHSGVGVRAEPVSAYPGMEEVKTVHSRTPRRRSYGPRRKMGRPLS